MCIVFEGWDAAGKGGAIKRLVEPLDPRHVHVAPFAAPTPDELRHHFLWRFWPPLPGWGGMTIFDRSWYGRVLVERVENLATEVQWRRAYEEITDFEHTLAEEGMIVIKLWMHMSHEEQLRRFVRRRDDPLKAWKLTDEDWRNREKRPRVRRGRLRHAAPDAWSAGALGCDLVGEQALWAGRGDRDGDPPHGGGDGPLGRPGAGPRRRGRRSWRCPSTMPSSSPIRWAPNGSGGADESVRAPWRARRGGRADGRTGGGSAPGGGSEEHVEV